MTFNLEAVPFAIGAVIMSLLVWRYRLAIVRQNARFRDRTLEEQERVANRVWVFCAWSGLLALIALFAPLWG